MWLFTRYGFFSIASNAPEEGSNALCDPGPVLIRARCRSHVENLQRRFGDLAGLLIHDWPGNDYPFRLVVAKKTWEAVLAELAREQTWVNFKDEVSRSLINDRDYIHAIHAVWSAVKKIPDEPLEVPSKKLKLMYDEEPRPDIVWDGITKAETLTEHRLGLKQELATSARNYDWPKVLAILAEHSTLANSTRPGGHSLFTPLHQAAHAGASIEIVSELLRRGAWRTARDSNRNRPLEIARQKSHSQLEEVLTPVLLRDVPADVLLRIQANFHEVINGRAADLIRAHHLRLPQLEVMLEFHPRKFWFPVPEMYGGFAYWLAYDGPNAKLITESWCRVVGGSGQRHEITASGSQLIDEGFV